MKHTILSMAVSILAVGLSAPMTPVSAEMESAKADYQYKVDKQVQDIESKIDQVKRDYDEDGIRVNRKIKEYQERIAEIKEDAREGKKSDTDIQSLVKRLNKDFNEWRLKRSIQSYEEKIGDIKERASYETNPDKKRQLEEKFNKLDAKQDALQAKLNDLRMTNGDNWDKIERELDRDLEDIERDYKNIM